MSNVSSKHAALPVPKYATKNGIIPFASLNIK